jgi:pyruvate formate lyase activating enzyme
MCTIKPGKKGFCGSKINQDGSLISLTYGKLSAIGVDPIEKKPLAHFYPGSRSFSVSSIGCSFTCPWCQNYHISMGDLESSRTQDFQPEQVVEMAMTQECSSIAYTYNEPLINLDWVEDTARFAKDSLIKNVLVTNGYVSHPALERVVDVIDAANVDWKAFTDEFYRKHCNGDLQSVLDATKYMFDKGVHIEVTFLVIPGENDDPSQVRDMSRYIVEKMGAHVPLHLSRFFPMYKFQHVQSTPVETLLKAKEIALEEGLHYVFVGNVRDGGHEDTVCPECGKPVILRRGYDIKGWHLNKEKQCEYCGFKVPIVGNREIHRTSWF